MRRQWGLYGRGRGRRATAESRGEGEVVKRGTTTHLDATVGELLEGAGAAALGSSLVSVHIDLRAWGGEGQDGWSR